MTGDLNDKTVAGLLGFCEWLSAKGYATSAQVNPWKIATRKVFETVEGESYDSLDLSTVDLDEYLARFQTLAGAQYKAESITAYKRRILNAVEAHNHYLATGRPPTFRQGPKRVTTDDKDSAGPPKAKITGATQTAPGSDQGDGMIDFPFPLKNGRMANLHLPPRLAPDDVNRLSSLLRTLQDDGAEQRQIPEQTGEPVAA